MTKAVFKRVGATIVPASPEASEAMMAIKDGQRVMMTMRAPRWLEHHNKYWALCEVVASATGSTKDSVSDYLLTKLNLVDLRYDPLGRMEIRPKSIAFENMNQDKFARMYDAAVPLMVDLIGCSRSEFMDRFNEIYEGRAAA